MNITLVTVGRLKEKYLKDAVGEYTKRLSRYCKITIIELQDEKVPDNASEKDKEIIKDREGKRVLKHINSNMYIVVLDLNGNMITSEEFSRFIGNLALKGNSSIAFVIGGSLGISREILYKANYRLCFSQMTFPHQLFRVMLLEQIYRGFRILKGEPYHK
ncbi:MAG: 23S rRNA (pseudouridine(1915)-N(3))-methyltransferase RlmH [Clostridium sp.]|jgi:23S rRNA (pseudouridine1915-N3)-methyltransferase|uniref:23S rRNA (pseudouridine(1915)-N(3))-methyltransferase RlmH n=1 Tax=Clostridium sp. TaxID=1506 RepID=UPI0025BF4C89|nr:23S rRNA (pseudouridine(1915)-N(3))-methyltransferase RlmH [Clostridium sp.]MCH3963254.1 23S rRNA (pseudouridine(1915)-N(3))-methyltransferase RlmH [Clostridium sp.]MCI1717226.1 23S rRNA (pseudouridine(1915)-N(3))-methyltransferase RlmH [Clostridium sp.]MCI1801566.1 23S rRNA (pseudouridine(1915)-N(3))-methyltransferase RlmH [Clostridium sp.]MCI1815412.1 23S rRNA (pseudouridine(1915)-N(3))-methyltransferase RlmH [Clostridium sp.]MCI1872315.1 23S rRNA (pseudouridine(1915)-N(3))-methyltransfer